MELIITNDEEHKLLKRAAALIFNRSGGKNPGTVTIPMQFKDGTKVHVDLSVTFYTEGESFEERATRIIKEIMGEQNG